MHYTVKYVRLVFAKIMKSSSHLTVHHNKIQWHYNITQYVFKLSVYKNIYNDITVILC